MTAPLPRKRITIAILALGGQGGGVLADWILHVGDSSGYITQGTSVPGVAQRTGSTIYYIEMVPDEGRTPILALSPAAGDIDIVVASELMEAGRAMVRGFVTRDRTTLIGSTHRVYAISEKSAMGDGLQRSERIVEAAGERARRFIGFDMETAAARTGSVISSVMFGALAGSGALPFAREAFEAAIRASGIAVETNLRGFAAGWDGAQTEVALPIVPIHDRPRPTTAAGQRLADRIDSLFPPGVHDNAYHSVKRLMDYQDAAYAELYLDRLAKVLEADNGADGHALTREAARYLALWMSYEDTIRVADLKTRSSRIARVRDEVQAKPDQMLDVTEYMHPRLREVCETLPAALGKAVLGNAWLVDRLEPLFRQGRHVKTTRLAWFLALSFLAALRSTRRGTLRYREEQARIEAWLALVIQAARSDPAAARELVECQRLIKGYGDTFERGLRNYEAVTGAYTTHSRRPDVADIVRQLREAALQDEAGDGLRSALDGVERQAADAAPRLSVAPR